MSPVINVGAASKIVHNDTWKRSVFANWEY